VLSVEGISPEELTGDRSTAALWSALRASLHQVLDGVSVADLVAGVHPRWTQHLAVHEVAAAS
jgi:DNA-binding IscR family transcriptional regulator